MPRRTYKLKCANAWVSHGCAGKMLRGEDEERRWSDRIRKRDEMIKPVVCVAVYVCVSV